MGKAERFSDDDLLDLWNTFRLRVWRKLQQRVQESKNDGLDQAAIAERLGMDESQLSRVLSGKNNVTLRTMHHIARAVDCRPEIDFVKLDELVKSNHPKAGLVWGARSSAMSGNSAIAAPTAPIAPIKDFAQ